MGLRPWPGFFVLNGSEIPQAFHHILSSIRF